MKAKSARGASSAAAYNRPQPKPKTAKLRVATKPDPELMTPREMEEYRAEYQAQTGRELEYDEWDLQIARDAAAGKFDEMEKQAMNEHRAGKTRPFPE